MKLQKTLPLLAVTLVGCGYLRSMFHGQPPREDDTSIVFPQFFEHDAVEVGSREQPYELDGEMLRALVVATNDFRPSDDKDLPCPSRKDAQLYRVIRRENILFVYVYENPAFCGRKYAALDSGARYAISTDGRILWRLLDGQPERPFDEPTPGDGGGWFKDELGASPTFDALSNSHPDGGTDAG
jgi:hypothetical protein